MMLRWKTISRTISREKGTTGVKKYSGGIFLPTNTPPFPNPPQTRDYIPGNFIADFSYQDFSWPPRTRHSFRILFYFVWNFILDYFLSETYEFFSSTWHIVSGVLGDEGCQLCCRHGGLSTKSVS